MNGCGPRLSVVVPTRRRPELLARCLRALAHQDFAGFEIVVVGDGEPPAVAGGQHAFAGRLDVRFVALAEHRGPAAARNAGVVRARADCIAFTDDDTIPGRGWLAAGYRALAGGAIAVTGRTLVPLPRAPTDYELDTSRLAGAEFLTANLFCRRAALLAVGGFDERFTAAWREDSDLHFTLLERHGPHAVVRAADAIVVHPIRPAPFGVSVRLQSKSRFNALLYKKHRRLYRDRIQAGPPWGYYATVVSGTATAAALAAGAGGVALGCGAAWTVFYVRFLAQRARGTSRRPSHLLDLACTTALLPWLSVFWRLSGAVRYRVAFL